MSQPPSMGTGPLVPHENHQFPAGEKKIGAEGLPAVDQELAFGVDGIAQNVLDYFDFSGLGNELEVDAAELFKASPENSISPSSAALRELQEEAVEINNIASERGVIVLSGSSHMLQSRYNVANLLNELLHIQSPAEISERFDLYVNVRSIDVIDLHALERLVSTPGFRIFNRVTREMHGDSPMGQEERAVYREKHGEDIKEVVHDRESWSQIVNAFGEMVRIVINNEQANKTKDNTVENQLVRRNQKPERGLDEEREDHVADKTKRHDYSTREILTRDDIAKGILSDIQKEDSRKKEREKKAAEKERDIERQEVKKHERQEGIIMEEINRNEKRKNKKGM